MDLKIQGLLWWIYEYEYYTVVTVVVVTIEQKTVVPTFFKVFQTVACIFFVSNKVYYTCKTWSISPFSVFAKESMVLCWAQNLPAAQKGSVLLINVWRDLLCQHLPKLCCISILFHSHFDSWVLVLFKVFMQNCYWT